MSSLEDKFQSIGLVILMILVPPLLLIWVLAWIWQFIEERMSDE